MAQTFRSRQLRLERDMDERFGRDMAEIARLIALLLASYAVISPSTGSGTGGRRIIPNRRTVRDAIRAAIWIRILKPYFIGSGDLPFNGSAPLSPFARLIYDGVRGGLRITAEQQTALIRRATSGADDVYRYLTAFRPLGIRGTAVSTVPRIGVYDPFHLWVDPNGYTLSDRVWQSGLNARARINKLLDYHISRGTAFDEIAAELERFLTPGAAVSRTNTPYGREGSYAARRLARTEITAAAGRGVVNASIANPFVDFIRWALSLSHPCCDVCDELATGGPNGNGTYPPEAVPTYPAHPHELCNLQPVITSSRTAVIDLIRADMRGNRVFAGLFNENFLLEGLTEGDFIETAVVAEFVKATGREMAVIHG